MDAVSARMKAEVFLSAPDWANYVAAATREFWAEPGAHSDPGEDHIESVSSTSQTTLQDWLLFDYPVTRSGQSIVDLFLAVTSMLSDAEQSYLRMMKTAPLRLYELVDEKVGDLLVLRDLFNDKVVRAHFPLAGGRWEALPRWSRVAARVIARGSSGRPEVGSEMLVFISGRVRDTSLLDSLRERHDVLRKARPELHAHGRWGAIVPALHSAWRRAISVPDVRNFDDEPMERATAYFDVLDPDKLVAVLDVAPAFARNANDSRRRPLWAWIDPERKYSGNAPVILGQMELRDRTLVLYTNSASRVARGTLLLTDLGDGVLCHVETVCEKMDEATLWQLAEARQDGAVDVMIRKSDLTADELEEMLSERWERWVDEEQPELDGKTPREAAVMPALRTRLIGESKRSSVNMNSRSGRAVQCSIPRGSARN